MGEIENKLIAEILYLVDKYGISSLYSIEDLDFKKLNGKILGKRYAENELRMIIDDIKISKNIDEFSIDYDEISIYEELEALDRFSTIEDDKNNKKEEVAATVDLTLTEEADEEIEDFDDEEVEEIIDDEENEAVDQLELLEKYQNLVKETKRPVKVESEIWRNYIPAYVKRNFPKYKEASIEDIYDFSKASLKTIPKEKYDELFEFVCDISSIVFAPEEEQEDIVGEIVTDEISESILRVVEIIILPHQEVLLRLAESGGKIKFANIWNKPFNESLKIRVKDRDNWRCVVCEGSTDLHVHHKIPRRLGGIHHMHNLVTLCASCHKVIETADVNKAFQKCLQNYKVNKHKGNNQVELSNNKRQLKEEVETTLDNIMKSLLIKEESKLIEELDGVIKRLDVIFYS